MGKHILFPLLGLSLMVISLQALQCILCNRYSSEGNCVTGRFACQTKPGEICATVVTYKDGKFHYGRQKCAECLSGTIEHGSRRVTTNCCSASSFCNVARP
ncbi:urinary protein 3-like [Rattus rattus]|uniref:urinary protein 3-like n=1 Tax=Rattus rattus TaxID=10117 RepID=UPI0013F36DC7|nr:urinary protein 3-like [Rattus rattus]